MNQSVLESDVKQKHATCAKRGKPRESHQVRKSSGFDSVAVQQTRRKGGAWRENRSSVGSGQSCLIFFFVGNTVFLHFPRTKRLEQATLTDNRYLSQLHTELTDCRKWKLPSSQSVVVNLRPPMSILSELIRCLTVLETDTCKSVTSCINLCWHLINSAYCGGLWLASLRVMQEMATVLGFPDEAVKYLKILNKGKNAYHSLLWNGNHLQTVV